MARTSVLFVHNNFPGQFRHIAAHLAQDPRFGVTAFTSGSARPIPGVRLLRYQLPTELPESVSVHPFARRFEGECARAEQVMYLGTSLRAEGVEPDIIFVHPGWGEALPLRVLFPSARICTFCEFYYHPVGADVGFDREFPQMGLDGLVRVKLRNAATLLSLVDADVGISPTRWQRQVYPAEFRSKIRVIHEGIDVQEARPDPRASYQLPDGRSVAAGDEVVTFVARNLEPYRGYHIFMRALPALLRSRPRARVLIVGGTGLSYGAAPAGAESWASVFLNEVRDQLDLSRVYFLGHLERSRYLKVLQVSAAHVYLTYPFVLSWSMLEAMAAGCLVIGSDTPPVREVLEHGKTGVIVPFFDHDRIAQEVARALANPGPYEGLRSQARSEVVARYGVREAGLPGYIELVDQLAGGASVAV